MKLASVIIAVTFAAALLLAGCASAPGTGKETGYCSQDEDCHYYWYAGGCYTQEYMEAELAKNAQSGLSPSEAPKIPGASCTCERNACVMHALPSNGTSPNPACTADAKLCPDGSYVVRTGPDCWFAPCPAPSGNSTPPSPPAEKMTRELCESARGHWDECASACWDKPEAEICTLQCVQLCECGGETGWNCPNGYRCYAPTIPGILDNTGGCIPNAPSLPELAVNQEKYLNRTVTVEGVLRVEGNMFRSGKFFLDDEGASVEVSPWAPLSVSTCPPEITDCKMPYAMPSFLGKKLRATGKLIMYEYGNLSGSMIDVENAEILNGAAVPMTRDLCETGNGVFMQGLSGKESHCVCKSYGATGCPAGYECVDEVWDDVALGVCRKI